MIVVVSILKHIFQSIENRWQGLTSALSGVFCASLGSLNDKWTVEPLHAFRPDGVLTEGTFQSFQTPTIVLHSISETLLNVKECPINYATPRYHLKTSALRILHHLSNCYRAKPSQASHSFLTLIDYSTPTGMECL